MKRIHLLFLLIFLIISFPLSYAQEEDEQILYYQMGPNDDSLFIQIQESFFMDPPDPKVDIVTDFRYRKSNNYF
jgi:hypothetical protein